MCAYVLNRFSHAQLFVTPWTVAHQAPLSMRFPRQQYWSELPFPSPGDLPDPRVEPIAHVSPTLAARFFTPEPLSTPTEIMSTLRWKASKKLHNGWVNHNLPQTTPDILLFLLGCWRQHHLLPIFSRDGKEGPRLHLQKHQMTVWPLKWCHGKQPTKATIAMIQNNLVSPTRLEGREKREWEVNLHTCGLRILI